MSSRTRAPGRRRSASGRLFSLSEGETYEIGRTLGRQLDGSELVLLEGPLGIGKTVFARGIAAGLGIDPDQVCSPSYTIVQEYDGERSRMYHVDLYRVEHVDEIATLGLEELLGSGAVVVVEWGERLPESYRRNAMTVRLHEIGEAARRIEFNQPTRTATIDH